MKKSALVLFCGLSLTLTGAFSEDQPPKKIVSKTYSPVGELCTKEADEKGLINQEWRSFMAKCFSEHRVPNPKKQQVASCMSQNKNTKADKGRETWVKSMTECINKDDRPSN